MEGVTTSREFWAYLSNLEDRIVRCGLCVDDLPGLTGFRLRTVWATLTGSERYFSVMCLRAIEHVVSMREERSK